MLVELVAPVDSELEQVGTVLAACMEVAELLLAVAMPARAESLREKSAQLVGLVAVAEDPAQEPCHTWELARESTYRRQHTSMLGLEVILTLSDHEEISLASSQAAVC